MDGRGVLELDRLALRDGARSVAADLEIPFEVSQGKLVLAHRKPLRFAISGVVDGLEFELGGGRAEGSIDFALAAASQNSSARSARQLGTAGGRLDLELDRLVLRSGALRTEASFESRLLIELDTIVPNRLSFVGRSRGGWLGYGGDGGALDTQLASLDLGVRPLLVNGTLESRAGFWELNALKAELQGLAEVSMGSSAGKAPGEPQLWLLAVPDLGLLLAELGTEGLSREVPWFPAGGLRGRLDGTLRLPDAGGTAMSGFVHLSNIGQEQVSWSAASVDIPFSLTATKLELAASGMKIDNLQGRHDGGDWKIKELTLAGALAWPEGGVPVFDGEVRIDRASAMAADFSRALDAVSLSTALKVAVRSDGAWELELDAAAAAGELLWYDVYADLARQPLRLRSSLRLDVGATAELRLLELTASKLGRLSATGSISPDGAGYDLSLRAEFPSIAEAFNIFVVQALAASYPLLDGARAQGAATLDLRLRADGDGELDVDGVLEVQDLNFSNSEGSLELQGLSARIPLLLGRGYPQDGGAGRAESAPVAEPGVEQGFFALSRVSMDQLELGPVEVSLEAAPGRISAGQAFQTAFSRGLLTVDEFSLLLQGGELRLQSSLEIKSAAMAPIASSFGFAGISGELNGSFDKVIADASGLSSSADISAELFGGILHLRNPGIKDWLSRAPSFHADLSFDGIDLSLLSAGTGLGHVSGILRGSVENLSLVNGEPMSFTAKVETVPRRGVPQRVSFHAIRQISVLGGSGRDPFVSGLLQFFGDYRYAKMGFYCSLHNDHFRLQGIESHDGKDFLVVGTWIPPRVNVVSYNRDISFSQMMDRFETVLEIGQDVGSGGNER